MMQADTNLVTLFDGTVIERVEEWKDDPGTFDGWVEQESGTDILAANGANRSWAVAEICRIYCARVNIQTEEERKALLECENGAWLRREERLRRTHEAHEIAQQAILTHYRSNGKR